jgi:hypothetical protein
VSIHEAADLPEVPDHTPCRDRDDHGPHWSEDLTTFCYGISKPQTHVLLYSTSIHTWEVWAFGRPIAHGTLESCQREYPDLVPGYSQLLIECRYGRTHHDHDNCSRPRETTHG